MGNETRRFMRLMVLFDLPTTSAAYKRAYVQFRNYLLKDGYVMVQWSVYARIVNGIDAAEKHLQRLQKHLPREGSIRCLQITEKQFTQMKILLGERTNQEKIVNNEQFLLF